MCNLCPKTSKNGQKWPYNLDSRFLRKTRSLKTLRLFQNQRITKFRTQLAIHTQLASDQILKFPGGKAEFIFRYLAAIFSF